MISVTCMTKDDCNANVMLFYDNTKQMSLFISC